MNKNDLIGAVATQTDYAKKDVAAVVEEVFAQITQALVNREKVSIVGFGDFEARKRKARTGRNPQTGEPVEIAEKYAPAFKAKGKLKDAVQ
ncbi:HU family DNA-binding protein [Paenibacillus lautus]|uniref:HU family DNA-binding protein n=1 Tax=Paenibacillus lautus TaxID=1401 RepID=UPI001C7D4BF7|nr:HU family DNA-binding protein [Paenibacillus lautus]MBX4152215.1 HU family DNA-binding protein [Paenibacillus lautus]